ncbi:MAG: hypothetical protein GY953_13000, partial [bacterium]|nr:hypothetical protein [bacterium]
MRLATIHTALLAAVALISLPASARIPRDPGVESPLDVMELSYAVEPDVIMAVHQVRYYAKTPDLLLFLTNKDPVLVLGMGVLRIRLVGGAPEPMIAAEASASEHDAHFIEIYPASPAATTTAHGSIRYRDVYPGVDLVFRGDGAYVEHDFIVAAGGDPAAIRLRFEGAKQVHVNDEGALVMRVGATQFTLSVPVVYQEAEAGSDQVDASYRLADDGLEHLKGLTQLGWLHLNGTEVTDAGLEHLK